MDLWCLSPVLLIGGSATLDWLYGIIGVLYAAIFVWCIVRRFNRRDAPRLPRERIHRGIDLVRRLEPKGDVFTRLSTSVASAVDVCDRPGFDSGKQESRKAGDDRQSGLPGFLHS